MFFFFLFLVKSLCFNNNILISHDEKEKKITIDCKTNENDINDWISQFSYVNDNIELKDQKIINLNELKEIVLYNYASKYLNSLSVKQNSGIVIDCYKEEHVFWVNNTNNNLTIKRIRKIVLKRYASKILKKINIEKIGFLYIFCNEYKQIEWINNTNIEIKNINYLLLEYYALEILKKQKNFERINIFDAYCNQDKDVLIFLNEFSTKMKFKETKTLNFKGYASKLLMNLEVNNPVSINVECINNDHVDWISDSNILNIKEIEKLVLYYYAIQIITKMNIEKIKKLNVDTNNREEFFDWIENSEMFKIKEIGELILKEHESRLLSKLITEKIRNLIVICYFYNLFEWLNKEDVFYFQEITKLFLYGYSSKILLKTIKKKTDFIYVDFYEEIEVDSLIQYNKTINNKNCKICFISTGDNIVFFNEKLRLKFEEQKNISFKLK